MIPKQIFIYWHNNNYPEIIKYNINRIRLLHPDYKLYIINKNNVSNFINLDKYNFNFNDKLLNTPAYFSDILRILLLSKYGGIWLDASLILWKRIDNIIKENDKLVLIRNHNNDNGYNNKGFESWFIASVPNNSYINQIKKILIDLNTYEKINSFIKKIYKTIKIQKNVRKEYHLIYHIFSYVQQVHPECLSNYKEYSSDLFYPNNYIPNMFNIILTNDNTYSINYLPFFNYLAAMKIKKYLKYGEPKHIIASKLTYGIRNLM